jgi:aryl-alcohol dehydrogenase-like predicted oxidoreductase
VIARGNTLAELRGWSCFAGMQVEYSLITRDAERDLLPMADDFNIGVTAWAPLAGGALTGKYLTENDEPKRLSKESKRLNERSCKIAQTVVEIAKEVGCEPVQVAVNWVRKRGKVIIPIVGARNASQILQSLNALAFDLSEEQMNHLNEVSKIDLGFPHDFLQQEGVEKVLFGGLKNKIELP